MSNDEIVTKANYKKIKMLETDEMFFVYEVFIKKSNGDGLIKAKK